MTMYEGDARRYGAPVPLDRAIAWDAEGYSAGVYTGPEFGCIHWAPVEE